MENTKKVYVYKGFERFWHWTQSFLIIFLAITGFEIHSSYSLFGFDVAVDLHNKAAWAFIVLIVFAIFLAYNNRRVETIPAYDPKPQGAGRVLYFRDFPQCPASYKENHSQQIESPAKAGLSGSEDPDYSSHGCFRTVLHVLPLSAIGYDQVGQY
jgi:hypothetical protein